MFEYTKGVIRNRKSYNDRQRNGQRQKDKQRSTKHTHKTKDPVTRTPLKTGIDSVKKYREIKRITQRETRQSHWNYVNNIMEKSMEEGSNKSFWKYIKSHRKDNIGVAGIKENGVLHQDSETKANLLNKQFQSVFTKDDPKEKLPTLPQSNYPSISDIIINIEGIEKLLKNININKASGPDNIPNWILKNCAYEIAPCIASIFQLTGGMQIYPLYSKK